MWNFFCIIASINSNLIFFNKLQKNEYDEKNDPFF